ncbi:DUF2716 domain-containing protein [Dactylosporangium sp. NPDC050588]|uniref:DUF2716 domain-containing protein n=1 Tax=Dactylosporangium sp. NPDC050588 TaxID=3157211 RepID=UPI0034093527
MVERLPEGANVVGPRAVVRLKQAEYDRVWDRFSKRFGFRPGMARSTWPAIREPVESVTWSLDRLDDDPGDVQLDAMVAAVHAGLRECTPPRGTLLVLDWQHECFRIRPHRVAAGDGSVWVPSVMPDADYHIHLAENFSYGTFGHPWERTLCVMGSPLLDRVGGSVKVEPPYTAAEAVKRLRGHDGRSCCSMRRSLSALRSVS